MQPEMKYIYTVYQCGSFSKAAEKLFLTQPALSISVQKAEHEVGMPLFNRDKKPLELTEAGMIYIQKIEQIQHLEQELAMQLNDLTDLKTGHLRVGGTHYFNAYILPPVIAAYKKKFPGISLQLIEAGSWELIDMLKNDKIDLTFNCTPDPSDKLRRSPSFQDTILLAVPSHFSVNCFFTKTALSSQDVLARKFEDPDCPSITLQAFTDTPFILLTPGNNLRKRSMTFFKEAGITPNITMEVSQLVTSYHLARSGIGAAFISDWMLTNAHPEMSYYKINSPASARLFDIVTSGKNYLSKAQKAFIDLFQAYYKKNADKKTGLYPGVKKLVNKLSDENYSIGVVSAKGDIVVKELVESFLGDKVNETLGEKEGIKRKPAPDSILIMMDTLKCKPEETIYVGDSEVDVEAAANAGIRCASVTWGFRDKEDLEKINPLYIADNVQELYELIKG